MTRKNKIRPLNISLIIVSSVLLVILIVVLSQSFLKRESTFKNDETTSENKVTLQEIYSGRYFSIKYPASWYEWSFGRGIYLEYFQINSIPSSELKPNQPDPNYSILTFDVQRPEGSLDAGAEANTEERKEVIESWEDEVDSRNVTLDFEEGVLIDSQPALVYETYIKQSPPQTFEDISTIKELHRAQVEQIISTFKFLDKS